MGEGFEEWWNWDILTRRCPACRRHVPDDECQQHAADHWLNDPRPATTAVGR